MQLFIWQKKVMWHLVIRARLDALFESQHTLRVAASQIFWLLTARRAAPCCVGSIWDISFDRRVQISAVSEFQRFSSSGLAVIAKKRSKYGKMQGIPNITKGLVLSLTVDPISWGRLTTESSETLSLVKSCRMLSNLVKSCQNFVHSGLKLFQNVQKTKKALQIAKQLPKMPKNCLKCSKF